MHINARITAGLLCGLITYSIAIRDDAFAGDFKTPAAERQKQLSHGADPKGPDEFLWLESRIQEAAKIKRRTVVGLRIGTAQGSGVIVSADGLVLTAAHVVGKPDQTAFIYFDDGRMATGKTLGLHRATDAGMVRIQSIQGKPVTKSLPFASIQSQSAVIGQWCIAMGHPGGVQNGRAPSVRVGRVLEMTNNIVTDCTLISGDSGGPLFDLDGKLIALHSRIGVDVKNNIHLPISLVKKNWSRLRRGDAWGNPATRPFLGVRGRATFRPATVDYIFPDSPAAACGIQVGDEILYLGKTPIRDFNHLVKLVAQFEPGDRVWLRVRRNKKPMNISAFIGGIPPETFKDGEGKQ